MTPLIDMLPKAQREPLKLLAETIGASDDTAVMAYAAWQSFSSMPAEERTSALSLVIALEEIKRKSEGLEPLFKVERRGKIVNTGNLW